MPNYTTWFDEVAQDLRTQKFAMQGGREDVALGRSGDLSEMENLESRLVVNKGDRSAVKPVWGPEHIIEEIGLSMTQHDWQETWEKPAGCHGLLLGPVLTGKTMMTQELANRYGLSFISISLSDICGKWLGESQKYVTLIKLLTMYYSTNGE